MIPGIVNADFEAIISLSIGDSEGNIGVADLRYESSFVGFLKPRPKLTFGWVQDCHS